MTVRLGPEACGTLDEAARREWLVADGAGGYAMGTVAGLRTRRYHGLLAVAVDGPGARMLGLAALDPVLVVGDARHRLATDEWGDGTVDPRGHELLVSFDLEDGVPRWRWQVGGLVLERELAMAHGSPVVGVVHRLLAADRAVRLELTPLCTWRSVHGERFANGLPDVETTADGFVFESAYRLAGAGWSPGGEWYREVCAREESARGLNDREDLWAAGTFAVELEVGEEHELTAAAAPYDGSLPAATDLVAGARARASRLLRQADATDGIDRQLVLAADRFAITTRGRPTAVAGYPWFGEWSRDLMTSYEGLYLATRREEEGRMVLLSAAASVSEGMLANTADTGSLEYNTVDGTLWFVHAVGRHVEVTGDDELAAEVAPVLGEIVRHHVEGTRYGIGVDRADGLLRQGAEGLALTWMDARIDGEPVTQRAGKPVEVNALWIRALDVVAQVVGESEPGRRCRSLHARAAQSFTRRFVRHDGHGLLDVVDGPAGDDASLRPNQLLAASLPGSVLDLDVARAVVRACRDNLLTPLGLRSLAPDDPRYRAFHRGSPGDRDRAYHQGTVWPWLLGAYVEAARKAAMPVAETLAGIELHLGDWGLGSISETADGAAPHVATGCPFQAWSVAEILRVRRELQSPRSAAAAPRAAPALAQREPAVRPD
jgi:predicted glycogen debranching enzyme